MTPVQDLLSAAEAADYLAFYMAGRAAPNRVLAVVMVAAMDTLGTAAGMVERGIITMTDEQVAILTQARHDLANRADEVMELIG